MVTGELKNKIDSLWDIFAEKDMKANDLTSTLEAERKIGHMIADSVYERVTGESGYFDTQIVFVSERALNLLCFSGSYEVKQA